jgi:hypothetical protein
MMDGHPVNVCVSVAYQREADNDSHAGPLVDETFSITSTDSVYSASDALRRMADDLDKVERLPTRYTGDKPVAGGDSRW